ncbi:alpha/beta fold hydrolase [Variovorax sp. HJSM1_2]|uniref:alpha/beta fold hydrolase n=1 Tax=Variovorax sp. HJSM1_2 TaxID=3366263 RepID=UPI003BC50C81
MSTWILLRGLTRESGHWGSFVSQFEAALPGQRVIALDLPGNGRLHAQCSPADVQGMVAHCRTTLAEMSITEPVALLGMSLGAMVAVAWAHGYPSEVSALVLVNTSLRPFSPFYQRLRPRTYAPLLRLVLRSATAEEWEQTILRITSNTGPARHAAVLAAWVGLREQHPVARANALRQLLAATRYRAPASSPRAAMLLLASDHDGLVSPQCSATLAARWQCDLQRHPTAGHDLPLDDAPWVLAQIRRWWLEHTVG